MSRRGASWPYIVGVAVLGVGLGTLIAGLPQSSHGVPYRIPAEGTPVTIPVEGLPIDTGLDLATTTAPATTEVVTTTTEPATTTTAAPTTVPTTEVPPPVTEVAVRDRADVRLVVANGDGRFNLVGANVARLRALGYVTIDQTDVTVRPPSTIIYVRQGFDREAAVLAQDLDTPGALIVPLDAPVTASDDLGDLVVVLGPDAQR